MTAFLHRQSKVFFFFQKKIFKEQSNSKAQIKGNRYSLTSYNVNYVTEHAPRDDNGNVTLIAQEAKQDFIFHFAI